ncbi:hypothetical protein MAR_038048 [Mya arenaria]|uniref:HECT domain-containing protein n=1 Tax=Mya arenaria TaxID=6604 RepID=A0ABY7FU42_MYAAR|nr:hypothetical protein MAR_038048 [Mya arenaria]
MAITRSISDILCSDLVSYRMEWLPILDRIIGENKVIVSLKVDRENLFQQVIDFYKKCNPKQHVQVIVRFVNEQALDGAGVRRELYYTFFEECLGERRHMFVGEGRHKFPSNEMNFVNKGYFEALGRAIVASVLNGDCGFPYLSPIVYKYLVGEDYTDLLTLDAVPDPSIKALVKDLRAAKSADDLLAVIDSKEGALKNIESLIQQLIKWDIVDKRKSSMDNLKLGLEHMGFLQKTKRNPSLLPLLVFSEKHRITAYYLTTKLSPKIQDLKCDGDHKKESAKSFMLDWLHNLTDEDAESFYQFVTGSADPTVADEEIVLEFNTFEKGQKFPKASTCSFIFRIPLGNANSSEFQKSIKVALDNAKCGFD